MQPGRDAQLRGDLGRIFTGEVYPPDDRTLLDRFVRGRDEAAFEALLIRHGPMVRGVCRRLLGRSQDADDAFQATFVVLLLKARRVEHADRLAPWLAGVATRVALKARVQAARRQARLGTVPVSAIAPSRDHDFLDVMPLLDAEIARLPAKLRAAVVLCLVEGATAEDAARRLACPVGTVRSRLARGRDALRARLTRRGVAPSLALAAPELIAPVHVPAALVRLTLATLGTPTIPPALLTLTRGVAPAMISPATAVALVLGGVVLTGGGLTTTWIRSSAQAQAPAAPVAPSPPRPETATPLPLRQDSPFTVVYTPIPNSPLADRFAAIKAEFAAQQEVTRLAVQGARTQREWNEIYAKTTPDDVVYCRRMIDLALTNPADPAARDALIWVVNKPYRADFREYGDEFARAGALLIRYHGDDPVAVAIGLGMTNVLSDRRDALVRGFYASARSHEAKGIARLALAQYLAEKAKLATGVGPNPKRGQRIVGELDSDDKRIEKTIDETDEDYTYRLGLSLCDPKVIQAEAERMYHEVISDYGDVPYTTTRLRELAALLAEPEPKSNGKPLTTDEIAKLRTILTAKRTLGAVAEAKLDEMHNIVPGKPAPEIDGVTLDGKPLKLADHRGKVVVLVFWGSWCGPCMVEIPHERELAERLKDRPFALLGVDCNEDAAAGRKAVEANGMTWPSWHDGPDGSGPIAARYHIRMYPTTFVIDAQGVIRHQYLSGHALDEAVDKLLAEAEAKRAAQ